MDEAEIILKQNSLQKLNDNADYLVIPELI